jgi:hypothetical protein
MRQHTLNALHAERIVTELLEAVIDGARHPLAVCEVEGDAVFFYAVAEGVERETACDVLAQAMRFFTVFQTRSQELVAGNFCVCESCNHIPNLTLKVVLHHGPSTIKQVKQFRKISGEHVIIAHRLLKNSIQAKRYLLMTEEFFQLSGGMTGIESERRTESYDDVGELAVRVYYPVVDEIDLNKRAPLSARIKQDMQFTKYTFSRLFGKKERPQFRNLPEEKIEWRGMF